MNVIGIGVDTVEIKKVQQILDSKSGASFLEKHFTVNEQKYFNLYNKPAPHIATTFAGKEAVFKALNAKTFIARNIEISRDYNGQPKVNLTGSYANMAGNNELLLSLSYNNSFSIAFAIMKEKK